MNRNDRPLLRPMGLSKSTMNALSAGSTLTIGRHSFDVHQTSSSSSSVRSGTVAARPPPVPGPGPAPASYHGSSLAPDSPTSARVRSLRSTSISRTPRRPDDPVLLTLWFHELRLSAEDVVIDPHAVPGLKIGDVCELQAVLRQDEPAASGATSAAGVGSPSSANTTNGPSAPLGPTNTSTSSPPAVGKKLYFTVTSKNFLSNVSSPTTKPNFQLSLALNPLLKLLDVLPRSLVLIRIVADPVPADSVEIFIKDVNLSRDSMWMLSLSLVGSCVYGGQRLSFLNNRAGTVKYIYKNGRKVFSAYVDDTTKIVYRSESAKLTFLVQLSREMWHFEENGEIMFHKLVNTLFPKIFKKWRDQSSHHSITIVLFTSVDLTDTPWTALGQGERPNNRRDYFRVVVDQVNIFHWDKIMANLRLEFANFKRDIMLNEQLNKAYVLEGEPLPSVKGNILEAINLGLTLVTDRFRNTDLKHCLTHFIVVTPGTGLFDVDYNLLLETSRKMHAVDVALDLVCLSQAPLHIVPLFRFKNPQKSGKLCYCVPNWCDISFYKDAEALSQWIPRCKIYELQMMGVMENNINDVSIDRLKVVRDPKALVDVMDLYDQDVFAPVKKVEVVPTKKFTQLREKQATFTLSLIHGQPAPPAVTRVDLQTTPSSVLGTVTNVGAEVSALSALYSLNKDDTRIRPTTSSSSSVNNVSLLKSMKSSSTLQEDKKRAVKKKRELSDPNLHITNKKLSVVAETSELSNEHWTEILNPSKEQCTDLLGFIRCSRWNEVFPPKIKRKLVKWRSFQAPAALPVVTNLFPSKDELANEYTSQIYSVTLAWENELELKTNYQLMREMIQLRLALGFQVCYSDRVKEVDSENLAHSSKGDRVLKYFPSDEDTVVGGRIYLSLDDEIHRIYCEPNGNLNVLLYKKIRPQEKKLGFGYSDFPEHYNPLIRTRYADEYTPAQIDIVNNKIKQYNWNQFDQLLAGYDDALPEENKEFHKMKFVVVPTDIPKNAYYVNNEKLSDEEIRVEGLRRLIALIERGKYVPEEERRAGKKEEILPEINFYTGNLYDFLNDQAELYDTTGNPPMNSLMLSNASFNRNIKLFQVAQEMQKPGRVKLVDRIWHFKIHPHCFLGNEMVSWLIEYFEDIDNREAATEYGQLLMDKKLFKHVENRHGFLDGYYFYQLEDEYVDKTKSSGWFNRKKASASNLNDNRSESSKQSDTESAKSPYFSAKDPSIASLSETKPKKKFILSSCVKYNADPLGKSFKPEILSVHYDRVHNPEHCYHIRFQWLNTTKKFVDETIINWSRLCERHGLKLVETPWKELCTIPKFNPFHSFVDLKLAINPWLDPEFADENILKDNKFYYHLYLLKWAHFLLDNRSSIFFLKDHIDISYSWGKPIFQYAQYIHETGAYIVELRENGDFFLAPNNIHLIRLNTLLTSVHDHDSIKNNILDSQKIMLEFRHNCSDHEILRRIFRDAKTSWRESTLQGIVPDI